MKKLVFVTNNLETGGVQISLLNLIKEIHDDYEITVFSFVLKDEYEKLLPENVKLVGTNSPFKYLGLSQGELKNTPVKYISRFIWGTLVKILGRSRTISLMSLFQKKIKGYDYAVSYLHEGSQKSIYGGCNEFVLKKIETKKKIAWLHCDFEQCGANNAFSRKIYSQFDKIVACSEGCKASFVKCMPELADKCISIRNCNDYEKIRSLAENGVEYDKNSFNIVTVARLSKEKGIDRALNAVKYCVDKGCKIKYHIVGAGPEEAYLKNIVKENDLENVVSFYGNQTNPYQYMVNADLFLLTSYHEAAPMVFDEAACLGIPVLATKTTSTDEMILENEAGFVCDNTDGAVKLSLFNILKISETLDIIKNNLKIRDFNNNNIINNFKKELIS